VGEPDLSASLRFDGRVAVVTGAGDGMGRAHAQALAARGATVVIGDVTGAEAAASELVAQGGVALGVRADVTVAADARALVDAALGAFGRVDVVVNNAGILRAADVTDSTDALWEEVLGVNLRGAFLVTRAAWPAMIAQGFGRVVFTTSNSGLLGVPGSSAYAASKAGLWGLVRVLALEGAEAGIHTNGVAPLAFTTMSARSRAAPSLWREGTGDAWAARLAPSLVSPVVAWLAHERCRLNGEVLSAAGGRVARFFLGLTPGIVDGELTVESVRAHEGEILAEDGYEVLGAAAEENRRLYRRLMG
jgi:NAD(P)-dependent dehydrogenase (short-subunit alcohol dehydrogenase family)